MSVGPIEYMVLSYRGHCLERRSVGVGQGPAGRPEDVPQLEILDVLRLDDGKGAWVKVVGFGNGGLSRSGISLG